MRIFVTQPIAAWDEENHERRSDFFECDEAELARRQQSVFYASETVKNAYDEIRKHGHLFKHRV